MRGNDQCVSSSGFFGNGGKLERLATRFSPRSCDDDDVLIPCRVESLTGDGDYTTTVVGVAVYGFAVGAE